VGGTWTGEATSMRSRACCTSMLTGEPPFTAPTADGLIRQHLTLDPPPVTTGRPTVPAYVAAAINRALAKVPADRFETATRLAEALQPGTTGTSLPRASVRMRGSRRWMIAAGGLALVLGATLLWRTGARTPDPAAGPRIAVLPFAPVVADTALQRMGRELAAAITANLDGMGELRTVDALTVSAETRPGTGISLDAGHELVRRLGASRLIHGALTHAGAGVRLDGALYEAGVDAPIARASVTADDLLGLGDAATIGLLDGLWQVEPPLAASLAAVRQSTVPAARRAYLAGELAMARSQWQTAIDSYEAAFATDTTFWCAYWRSLYPRSHRETERADPALVNKVIEHRHELPEPDRLLIEATRMTPRLTDRLERLRALTVRFPNYEPAWWWYANTLVHFGGYVGHEPDEAQAALERVLDLNPRFTAAWDHLQWVALVMRDSATAVRAAQEAERLGAPIVGFEDVRRVRVEFFGSLAIAPERIEQLADLLLGAPSLYGQGMARGFVADGFPLAQIQVNQAVRRRGPGPEVAAAVLEGEALAWAARGAWDSVLVAADRLAQVRAPGDPSLWAYRLAVAGAALGAIPVSEAQVRRPRAAPSNHADLLWLDGVLAYLDRGIPGIAAVRSAVADLADSEASQLHRGFLDRSLGALELDASGNRAAAARQLVDLETEIADRFGTRALGQAHPLWAQSIGCGPSAGCARLAMTRRWIGCLRGTTRSRVAPSYRRGTGRSASSRSSTAPRLPRLKGIPIGRWSITRTFWIRTTSRIPRCGHMRSGGGRVSNVWSVSRRPGHDVRALLRHVLRPAAGERDTADLPSSPLGPQLPKHIDDLPLAIPTSNMQIVDPISCIDAHTRDAVDVENVDLVATAILRR